MEAVFEPLGSKSAATLAARGLHSPGGHRPCSVHDQKANTLVNKLLEEGAWASWASWSFEIHMVRPLPKPRVFLLGFLSPVTCPL